MPLVVSWVGSVVLELPERAAVPEWLPQAVRMVRVRAATVRPSSLVSEVFFILFISHSLFGILPLLVNRLRIRRRKNGVVKKFFIAFRLSVGRIRDGNLKTGAAQKKFFVF